MDAELDVVVAGAGVVGLAVARALARAGREVHVLEAASAIGTHSSSRNSEVIHAGIYYDPGSLKARLCVRGRDALYAYCAEREIPCRKIGKLLVAVTEGEIATLDRYRLRAAANGVTDLVVLDGADVRALEPEVRCVGGLLSPSTGIVDSHSLMRAYKRDSEAYGAHVLLNTPVLSARVGARLIELDVGGADPIRVRCRSLVNAAGLFAQTLAHSFEGLGPQTIPPRHLAKGHYFVLSGPSPFRRLVYPMPVAGGLGVHVTLDLAGQARFGPDVSWIDDIDYAFDESLLPAFYDAIRSYFPRLERSALMPGYTGIRPKLGPASDQGHDFVIQGPPAHGVEGLVNLYGIESPGLTAALAIADEVAALL